MDERTETDLKRLRETSEPAAAHVLMQIQLWRVCELLKSGRISHALELAIELDQMRQARRKKQQSTQRLIDADPEN